MQSCEYGQSSDQPIRASTEVFVIYAALSGVHIRQRIPNNVFEERTIVDLPERESQRVRSGVAEHHKLISGDGFEKVQSI